MNSWWSLPPLSPTSTHIITESDWYYINPLQIFSRLFSWNICTFAWTPLFPDGGELKAEEERMMSGWRWKLLIIFPGQFCSTGSGFTTSTWTCLQLISTSTSTEKQRTKRSGRSGWTSGLCWSGLEHSDRTLHWCFVFYYCKWNYWNNPQFLSLTEQLGSISMAQTVSGTLDRDRWRHWRFLMESWYD